MDRTVPIDAEGEKLTRINSASCCSCDRAWMLLLKHSCPFEKNILRFWNQIRSDEEGQELTGKLCEALENNKGCKNILKRELVSAMDVRIDRLEKKYAK